MLHRVKIRAGLFSLCLQIGVLGVTLGHAPSAHAAWPGASWFRPAPVPSDPLNDALSAIISAGLAPSAAVVPQAEGERGQWALEFSRLSGLAREEMRAAPAYAGKGAHVHYSAHLWGATAQLATLLRADNLDFDTQLRLDDVPSKNFSVQTPVLIIAPTGNHPLNLLARTLNVGASPVELSFDLVRDTDPGLDHFDAVHHRLGLSPTLALSGSYERDLIFRVSLAQALAARQPVSQDSYWNLIVRHGGRASNEMERSFRATLMPAAAIVSLQALRSLLDNKAEPDRRAIALAQLKELLDRISIDVSTADLALSDLALSDFRMSSADGSSRGATETSTGKVVADLPLALVGATGREEFRAVLRNARATVGSYASFFARMSDWLDHESKSTYAARLENARNLAEQATQLMSPLALKDYAQPQSFSQADLVARSCGAVFSAPTQGARPKPRKTSPPTAIGF